MAAVSEAFADAVLAACAAAIVIGVVTSGAIRVDVIAAIATTGGIGAGVPVTTTRSPTSHMATHMATDRATIGVATGLAAGTDTAAGIAAITAAVTIIIDRQSDK